MGKKLNIVSGKDSLDFWFEINSISNYSTGDDISSVLYFMGCKMQELETEIEKLIERTQELEYVIRNFKTI